MELTKIGSATVDPIEVVCGLGGVGGLGEKGSGSEQIVAVWGKKAAF